MTRHRHVWRLFFREGKIVEYLADGKYRCAIFTDVYGCDCGKTKRVKPRRCPTCGRARRVETRRYRDRAEYARRAARARFRGYVGPGALARYRADLAAGVAITPPAPPEDRLWARGSA